MDLTDYAGREGAYVKHYVLAHYLEALAYKVAQSRPGTTLNYIDGFSGPWQAARQDQGDTSPAVALRTLQRVRADLAERGVAFTPRGLFVEKDPAAFQRLHELLERFDDMEVLAFPGEFENRIDEATRFATQGQRPFAFIFIDPTGWTGMPLRVIAPLPNVTPGEVLINFMLKDIMRFVNSPEPASRPSFDALFGQASEEYLGKWRDLDGMDREDAIVAAYIERVREVGRFEHAGSTIILNPKVDRTHYHLVYATRSRHGMKAFREVEREADQEQLAARGGAKARRREERTAMKGLFDAEELPSPYAEEMRRRYHSRAQQSIGDRLKPGAVASYDDLFDRALRHPLTSEADLKRWLNEMALARLITCEGLGPRERTPKIEKGHRVRVL